MISLDGNYLEGGGQIVRTALALSTLTDRPFEVKDIRAGRPKPGLKAQHSMCIKALQQLCDATVEGNEIGSEYLKYIPKRLNAKNLEIDIGTAGSITLLLQSLLLPCFFLNKKIKISITGGTDVMWSPPFDYLNEVIVPQLRRFGEINLKLINRGYYPKGQGGVELEIGGKYKLEDFEDFFHFINFLTNEDNKINLEREGSLIQIKGISHASIDLEKANVAERQARAAEFLLKKLSCPVNIRTEYRETKSTGSGITLWAIFSERDDDIDIYNPIRLGADVLGERGKKAEKVGEEAAKRLIDEIKSNAPVDSYLADNLIPWLGIFGGRIKVSKVTNHTLTNIYVVEKFIDKKFEIKDNIISI